MEIQHTLVQRVLTRTGGYLRGVTSHSLQPYRGCPLGRSLCGVGCYVRHNPWILAGRRWGSFLEVRGNAADSYRESVDRERRWARRKHGVFSIFFSSSTEPYPPQERRFRVTRGVLEAMLEDPPDELIIQTHSHLVTDDRRLFERLALVCRLRVHLSIETDLERLPGLPAPGSTVERRFEAAKRLRDLGIETVITVSPLLPMGAPEEFFGRVARSANAVVIDHFIGGDGTADGRRTLRTPLAAAMEALEPASVSLEYRDAMVEVASRYLPGRVGVGSAGFAGHYDVP